MQPPSGRFSCYIFLLFIFPLFIYRIPCTVVVNQSVTVFFNRLPWYQHFTNVTSCLYVDEFYINFNNSVRFSLSPNGGCSGPSNKLILIGKKMKIWNLISSTTPKFDAAAMAADYQCGGSQSVSWRIRSPLNGADAARPRIKKRARVVMTRPPSHPLTTWLLPIRKFWWLNSLKVIVIN